MVESEVGTQLVGEFTQFLFIVAYNPTCSVYVDSLELTVDAVFVLKAMGDNIELQYPNSTQNQIIISDGFEQLGSSFFAKLGQAFE